MFSCSTVCGCSWSCTIVCLVVWLLEILKLLEFWLTVADHLLRLCDWNSASDRIVCNFLLACLCPFEWVKSFLCVEFLSCPGLVWGCSAARSCSVPSGCLIFFFFSFRVVSSYLCISIYPIVSSCLFVPSFYLLEVCLNMFKIH